MSGFSPGSAALGLHVQRQYYIAIHSRSTWTLPASLPVPLSRARQTNTQISIRRSIRLPCAQRRDARRFRAAGTRARRVYMLRIFNQTREHGTRQAHSRAQRGSTTLPDFFFFVILSHAIRWQADDNIHVL